MRVPIREWKGLARRRELSAPIAGDTHMHPGANRGQSCCTLSACHAAGSGAEREKRSATHRRQPADPSYGYSFARRPASRGSPTRGRRRPRHSASVSPRSTGASSHSSRLCGWTGARASSPSTSSSAFSPSGGSRHEQNADRLHLPDAKQVSCPRSLFAFRASTQGARALARSRVGSTPMA